MRDRNVRTDIDAATVAQQGGAATPQSAADGTPAKSQGDAASREGELRQRASEAVEAQGAVAEEAVAEEETQQENPDPGLRFVDVSAALPLAVPLADTLAGPGWIATWADAIVCFWEHELALGALDPNEPVYLLDVEPGRGVFASLLIAALDARLPSSRAAGLDWRYLLCSEQREHDAAYPDRPDRPDRPDHPYESGSRAALQRLHAHPRFAALVDAGRVDTAYWPLAEGGALQPDGRPSPIERTVNPPVALAAGWFSRRPTGMYAVHYGDWFEAAVDVSAADDGSHYMLSYRWQPASTDDLDPAWAPLVERYRASLVSARVLLSDAAMTLVDGLRRIGGERYLLLACDVGMASEADVRGNAPLTSDTWLPGESMLPVDFHALAWRQRGAWTAQRRAGGHGVVVQAVWSRAAGEPPAAARATLGGLIDRCEPGDALHLAQMAGTIAEHAPFDRLLTLLRTSAYDPAVLAAMLPHWMARVSGADDADAVPMLIAQGWRDALAQTWRHHLADASTVQFDAQLADAATLLGSWGLAREIWRSVLALDDGAWVGRDALRDAGALDGADEAADEAVNDADEADDPSDYTEPDDLNLNAPDERPQPPEFDHAGWRARVHLHLAHCLASSGALAGALTHLAHAHELAPDDQNIEAWQNELEARAASQRALPWYRPELARDGGLMIEPLGPEHADALLAAYADPHIAPLANLPVLNELQDVLTWLERESAEPGRTTYAVMDAQWGFVGAVSLCRADEAAYFYFWIGVGAQGQGFGPRAARLLFAQARAAGVVDIFTASYVGNGRSHEALRRLGFSRMPVRVSDDPQVRLFHFDLRPAGDARSHASSPQTLARFMSLCEAIDAPLALVPEEGGVDGANRQP